MQLFNFKKFLVNFPKQDEVLEKSSIGVSTWYVTMFQLFGAFVAASLFFVFLIIAGVIQFDDGSILFSLFLILSSLIFNFVVKKVDFLIHLLFAFNIAGQLLLYFSLGKMMPLVGINYIILFIQFLLLLLYHNKIYNILNLLLILTMPIAILFQQKTPLMNIPYLFLLSWLSFSLYFYESSWLKRILLLDIVFSRSTSALKNILPLERSMFIFESIRRLIPFVLLVLCTMHLTGVRKAFNIPGWYLLTILISFLLSYTVYRYLINDELIKSLQEQLLFKVLLIVIPLVLALATLNWPGIIISIYLLFLAWHRQQKILYYFSIISLFVFIYFFYYDINITLLSKSIVLFLCGSTLLIIRFVVVRYFFTSNEKTSPLE